MGKDEVVGGDAYEDAAIRDERVKGLPQEMRRPLLDEGRRDTIGCPSSVTGIFLKRHGRVAACGGWYRPG